MYVLYVCIVMTAYDTVQSLRSCILMFPYQLLAGSVPNLPATKESSNFLKVITVGVLIATLHLGSRFHLVVGMSEADSLPQPCDSRVEQEVQHDAPSCTLHEVRSVAIYTN